MELPAMGPVYKLDGGRTRDFYRAIVANNRAGMRNLLIELGRARGLVSACEQSFKDSFSGQVRAYFEDLEDISAIWMTLAMDGEALDRDQDWERFGLWVPA